MVLHPRMGWTGFNANHLWHLHPPTPTWLSNCASGICNTTVGGFTPMAPLVPFLIEGHTDLSITYPMSISMPRPVNHRNLSYYILSELIYLSSYTVDNNNPKIQRIFKDYRHIFAWYYNARENNCTFWEAHYE